MWPNPSHLAVFTEEILNGELHFVCSVVFIKQCSFEFVSNNFKIKEIYEESVALSHTHCNLTSSSKDEKIFDEEVKEDSWDLTNVSHLSQTNKMCNDAVSVKPCLSQSDPDFYK